MIGVLQAPWSYRESAGKCVLVRVSRNGSEYEANVGGEGDLNCVEQCLGPSLFVDLQGGLAFSQQVLEFFPAEQLQVEIYIALVVREVVHPTQYPERITFL